MEKDIILDDSQYDYIRNNLELLDSDMGKFLRGCSGQTKLINWLLQAEIDPVKDVKDFTGISYQGTNITSAVINSDVESIPSSCFAGSAITEVKIPVNCVAVGDSAFANCKKLKTVVMTNNVKEMGAGAFANCTALTKCYFTNTWVSSVANPHPFTADVFLNDNKVSIYIVKPTNPERDLVYMPENSATKKVEHFATLAEAKARQQELLAEGGYKTDSFAIYGGFCVPTEEVPFYSEHRVWITQAEMDNALQETLEENVVNNSDLAEAALDKTDIGDSLIDKINREIVAEENFKESLKTTNNAFDILNNFDLD